jgi:hypothetical protein
MGTKPCHSIGIIGRVVVPYLKDYEFSDHLFYGNGFVQDLFNTPFPSPSATVDLFHSGEHLS